MQRVTGIGGIFFKAAHPPARRVQDDRRDNPPLVEPLAVKRWTGVRSLRWMAIFLLLFATTPSSIRATTWGVVEKTCPLDGKLVRGHVPGSIFSRGSTPDFRPRGGADPFLSGMLQCPHCGFMTHADRFDAPKGLDKEKVAAELRKLDRSSLFYPIDAAQAVERCWSNDPGRLARLTLTAKWLADDTGEPDLIRARLTSAIEAHTALVAQLKPGEEDYAATIYLVGELHRQQGNMEEALRWFDKALPVADGHLKLLIQQQRSAAAIAGTAPAKIIDKLKQAPPAEQVAAIEFLRSADDAATVQFLNDVVLKSPEEFRETAMRSLIDQKPRIIHLPIYLQAITNSHFRTVQGGALAVEMLGAKEAAPLLVKALEKPVAHTDHRLAEALTATATPAEIPALKRLFQDRNKKHLLFRALINTESSEVVDQVLTLLEEDAFYPSLAENEEMLRALKSASRNVALVKRLPDLRTAANDSPAAVFKACVLALEDKPATADELAAATTRGGRLAFQAALALAKRRDARCRQVLVNRMKELLQQSHDGYLVLLPLLQPEDYAPIHRAFEQEVARQQEGIAQLKRDASKEKDEQEKARLTEQITERENRENWWMEQWLRLFGATRHPDAKPLLMNYVDDPNHQARAGAIDGLRYCYDEEVGKRLAARLAVEREIPHALVRALGHYGNRRELTTLLAVADKPTSIETKLALIEAFQTLQATDQLQPKLESWSRSPNPSLANAAKLALSSDRKPDQ